MPFSRRESSLSVRGVAAVLGLAAAIIVASQVAPSVALELAQSAAERRAMKFDASGARVSWRGISFTEVVVRPAAFPALRVDAALLNLAWDWSHWTVDQVQVTALRVAGPRQDWLSLLEQRKRASGTSDSGSAHVSRTLVIDGAEWRGNDAESANASKAELRLFDGLTATAKDVRFSTTLVEVKIGQFGFQLASDLQGLKGLEADEVLLRVSVPAQVAASATGAAAVSGASPEPGAAERRLFDASRATRIRTERARWSALLERHLRLERPIELRQLRAQVVRAGEVLNIGPGRLIIQRAGRALDMKFATRETEATRSLRLAAQLPLDEAPARISVAADALRLAEIGIEEGNFGLSRVNQSEVSLDASAVLDAQCERASFAFTGAAKDLALHQARLAPVALEGMNFSWALAGEALTSGAEISVSRGELALGAVKSEFSGQLRQGLKQLELSAHLKVPTASCQQMLDSLPKAALPLLAGARLRGQFAWQAGIELDTDQLSDVKVEWRMKNGCHFERVPDEASPERFRAPFRREVPGPDDEAMEVTSGPGSDDWVPLSEIAEAMESAVLTTEDGGFWRHDGFQQKAIAEAIQQNIAAGKFQRGASTISMQLAKNLYLSREKYLARKVQEALLTMLLEQELRKDELLELYLNAIEYGPGLYGIGPAARHYFGVSPSELSVAQAFFLASILPNPRAEHFQPNGSLSPKWQSHLQRLITTAARRGRLSIQQKELGLAEQLRFGAARSTAEEAERPL